MEYIENNEEYGIQYDFRKIKKEYEKLKIPSNTYHIPFEYLPYNKYFINLSERKTGKTTNWLLLGLVMNKLYGTVICYVRENETMLAPSHAESLVNVIKTYDNGRYINQLTDGKYNSMYYRWKQFYYCNVDENGEIAEKSETPVIQFLSIDKWSDYKSTLNIPNGDLILFDEFIGKYYRVDSALHFFDLLSTIIRGRRSPIVAMLANTINLNSMYFEEFEITKEVKRLKIGEKKQIVTEKGTHIYIELIDVQKGDSARHILNSLFFGFKNTKMSAITGGDLWAFENVPHILHNADGYEVIYNKLFIETASELLKVKYCYNDIQGYHLEVTRATKTYDDSIILSLLNVDDARYVFGIGTGELAKKIDYFVANRKVYYSSNEVGSIFKDYLQQFLQLKNKL